MDLTELTRLVMRQIECAQAHAVVQPKQLRAFTGGVVRGHRNAARLTNELTVSYGANGCSHLDSSRRRALDVVGKHEPKTAVGHHERTVPRLAVHESAA